MPSPGLGFNNITRALFFSWGVFGPPLPPPPPGLLATPTPTPTGGPSLPPHRRIAVSLGWVSLLRQLQPPGRGDFMLVRVKLPASAVRDAGERGVGEGFCRTAVRGAGAGEEGRWESLSAEQLLGLRSLA